MSRHTSKYRWPPAGLWRYGPDLPLSDASNIVSLGEGDTPLIEVAGPTLSQLPLGSLRLKSEERNPTGSFKDRIATVAASLIRERGLRGAVGTSSGNGGAAIAAYGARGGFPVVLFTVGGIVDGKLAQILAHGASAYTVTGFGLESDATTHVVTDIMSIADREGWLPFLTGANFAPEAMRGAETIALELAEQRSCVDVVYAPVGGGGLLASLWRGFARNPTSLDPPRLVGVQPLGCRTLERATNGDLSPLSGPVTTTISGLQVSELFDDDAADAIIQSDGHVTEVSDEQAWHAQRLLAREEGIFLEPAGATALAGLLLDLQTGLIGPDDHVVVIDSGAGHKDETAVKRLTSDNPARPIAPSDLRGVLADIGRRGR